MKKKMTSHGKESSKEGRGDNRFNLVSEFSLGDRFSLVNRPGLANKFSLVSKFSLVNSVLANSVLVRRFTLDNRTMSAEMVLGVYGGNTTGVISFTQGLGQLTGKVWTRGKLTGG